ncbi:helix-turn-helix domain-containing protein [Lacrimispora brassicae]
MGNLAENIRKYRNLASLNQEQLATKLGKSKNVISNWERSDNKPDADTIEKMCYIFNIEPNQLYGWSTVSQSQTISAHKDSEWSDEELAKIEEYKKLLLAARPNKGND